jgi:hypothetical protein
LHGLPGTPPGKQTIPLEWKTADLLEAAIPITGRETVLNTVEIPGQQPVTLAPVCLPYSPEFAPEQPGRGAAALAQLAATSGGKERIEIPQTWAELPVKPRYIELVPWLLVAALILFLLEVFERRTGWLGRHIGRKPAAVAAVGESEETIAAPAQKRVTSPFVRRAKKKPAPPPPSPARTPTTVESPAAPAVAEKPASTDTNLDSFRKARERAERRTNKNP